MLIKQIADKEGIDVAAVRRVFKAAEDKISDYLSSTTPSENMVVKPFKGISIEGKYEPSKIVNRGIFVDAEWREKIKIKTNTSRYYREKINSIPS